MHSDSCITPECGNPAYVRGLCIKCCRKARQHIADGKTSWNKLFQAGLAKRQQGKCGFREFLREAKVRHLDAV